MTLCMTRTWMWFAEFHPGGGGSGFCGRLYHIHATNGTCGMSIQIHHLCYVINQAPILNAFYMLCWRLVGERRSPGRRLQMSVESVCGVGGWVFVCHWLTSCFDWKKPCVGVYYHEVMNSHWFHSIGFLMRQYNSLTTSSLVLCLCRVENGWGWLNCPLAAAHLNIV